MTSVSTPPTILVRAWATPQLQVEEEVEAVVEPDIGFEVVVVTVVIVLGAESMTFFIKIKKFNSNLAVFI